MVLESAERISKALDLIDELIENYEISLDMYMTSDQPDNYFMTKQTIEDLEKKDLKKCLTNVLNVTQTNYMHKLN